MRDAKIRRWWHRRRRRRHRIFRGIQLIAKIHPHRADRSRITHAKSDRVRKIIQFRRRSRFPRQINVIHVAVYIAAIVKQRSAQAVADERQPHRKTQFLVEYQYRQASDGKTGARIARAGFVQTEASQRLRASGKKSFWQRDDLSRRGRDGAIRRRVPSSCASGYFHAEARRTREHKGPAKGMVGRILHEDAEKTRAGAEVLGGITHVRGIKASGFWVCRIIAPVACIRYAHSGHQRGLAVQWNLVLGNRAVQVRSYHAPEKISVLQRTRWRKLLRDLKLRLVAHGGESRHIQRLIRKYRQRRTQVFLRQKIVRRV